jgi:ubiquinone/menaquinone biosynthesis C-methylase UbiE
MTVYGNNIKFRGEIPMDIKQKETIEAYDNSAKDFFEKIGSIKNYDPTYDYLVEKLKEHNNVLDLACGPCQIGKYIKEKINVNITGVDLSREMLKIAQNNIPDGIFLEGSIVTFKNNIFYDLVIIGFGIPYLNKEQLKKCIKNSVSLLKIKGCLYISFMDGNKEGFEKTSFGGNNKYYIYYHEKEMVRKILIENRIHIEKEYILDYKESDGRITKDVIYIGVKNK